MKNKYIRRTLKNQKILMIIKRNRPTILRNKANVYDIFMNDLGEITGKISDGRTVVPYKENTWCVICI